MFGFNLQYLVCSHKHRKNILKVHNFYSKLCLNQLLHSKMAFTGKWKRTKFENHEEILKHIGMPKEVAKKMKNTDGILEIEQDGNTFNEVLTYGEKVTKSVLIVGKPSQFHTWNDDRVEVVPVEIGTNKIKVEYDHGGVHHCATRELITEAQFVDHINLDKGKLTGKIMYTKC